MSRFSKLVIAIVFIILVLSATTTLYSSLSTIFAQKNNMESGSGLFLSIWIVLHIIFIFGILWFALRKKDK